MTQAHLQAQRNALDDSCSYMNHPMQKRVCGDVHQSAHEHQELHV